jgi:hypothetical protein
MENIIISVLVLIIIILLATPANKMIEGWRRHSGGYYGYFRPHWRNYSRGRYSYGLWPQSRAYFRDPYYYSPYYYRPYYSGYYRPYSRTYYAPDYYKSFDSPYYGVDEPSEGNNDPKKKEQMCKKLSDNICMDQADKEKCVEQAFDKCMS